MRFVEVSAEIDFTPPNTRVDGTNLSHEDISHYKMTYSTEFSYSELIISEPSNVPLFIELTDNQLLQNEIDLQFSLLVVDKNNVESEPAFYSLILKLSDYDIGYADNIPISGAVIPFLFIIFISIFNKRLH